jgi:integrase
MGVFVMGSIRTRTESNALFFDFRYRGIRCKELTRLKPTKANIFRLEAIMKTMQKEIDEETFSYRKYFPNSKRADLFESMAPSITPVTNEELVAGAQIAAQEMHNTGAKQAIVNADGMPSFSEFSDLWFIERQISWKRSTQGKVKDILVKHLVPRFRGRRVHEISKADILAYRGLLAKPNEDGKTLSATRINGILNILKQILTEAADRHEFVAGFRGIKPLRISKTKIEPFSLLEVGQILEAAPKEYKPYLTTAFFTGMRTSELLGLTWTSVDLNNARLTIEQAWVDGEIDSTKTVGSERTIDLSTPVIQALIEQRKNTEAIKSEYVFCSGNGIPFSRHNFANRIWHPLLTELKIKRRRPYQTRHTAATLWLASGENPEWIARQMGHTSTRMLFTTYSRYVPNLTRKDGSAFEQLLSSQPPG